MCRVEGEPGHNGKCWKCRAAGSDPRNTLTTHSSSEVQLTRTCSSRKLKLTSPYQFLYLTHNLRTNFNADIPTELWVSTELIIITVSYWVPQNRCQEEASEIHQSLILIDGRTSFYFLLLLKHSWQLLHNLVSHISFVFCFVNSPTHL